MRSEMKAWQAILACAFFVWMMLLVAIGFDGLSMWWGEVWGNMAVPAFLTLIALVVIWNVTRTSPADRRKAEQRRIREAVRMELRRQAQDPEATTED